MKDIIDTLRHVMNENIHCSVSRAKKLIGLDPEISLRKSLLESIKEAVDKKAI